MWPQSSKRTPPWLHCMPNCEGNTTLNNPPGRGCDLAQMQFEHLQQLKTNTHMGYDKKAAALRNRSFSELEWTHINVDGVICSWQPSCMSTGAQQAAAVLPQEWADNVGAQRAAAVLPQELTDNVGATSPAYRCRSLLGPAARSLDAAAFCQQCFLVCIETQVAISGDERSCRMSYLPLKSACLPVNAVQMRTYMEHSIFSLP
eukprot:scaffold98245_cov20-Tisochrysis_lutea.AAC.1